MKKLKQKLSNLKCRRVIDIATRDGSFIKKLSDNLADYDEIIGIDISDKGFKEAKSKFKGNNKVIFKKADAYATGFPDQHFDLVCISNSLHHIDDLPRLLKEMKRIKKEDGLILISEMPSDGQAGSSLTHFLVHNLDAVIDTSAGIYHRTMYSHQEIYDLIIRAGLEVIDDFDDVETNLHKNKLIKSRVNKARLKVEKYKNTTHYDNLNHLANEILNNYKQHGANTAVQYIIFAK